VVGGETAEGISRAVEWLRRRSEELVCDGDGQGGGAKVSAIRYLLVATKEAVDEVEQCVVAAW
jgi:hypothetical protein